MTSQKSLDRYRDQLTKDACYTFRALTRVPGFSFAVLSLLALGIGVNTTVFTLLDRLYFRYPAGIESPKTLRAVYVQHFRTADGVPSYFSTVSYPAYVSLLKSTPRPENLALYLVQSSLRMGKSPTALSLRVVYASSNYFRVLGVRPAMGRTFSTEEGRLGNDPEVAVVSHRFWNRHVATDTAALGQAIPIGRGTYNVIGVLPPSFTGLELQAADVWLPLSSIPVQPWISGPWWESDNMSTFRSVLRDEPGGSERAFEARATNEMRYLGRQLDGQDADTLIQVHLGSILEARGPEAPPQYLIISARLGGVALIVLAIACANIVNLLMARAVSRRREIALRLALGISRGRLVWLLSLEIIFLSGGAAVAALVAASWGGDLLRTLLLPNVEWYRSSVDGRVALVTCAVAMILGATTGLVPALRSSRPALAQAFKTSSRSGHLAQSRLRFGLIVTQAALTTVLLANAVLFLRSLRNVQNVDIGYDANQLLFGSVQFSDGGTPPSGVSNEGMQSAIRRLRVRSSVEAVAGASFPPMGGFGAISFFTRTDSAESLQGSSFPTFTAVTQGFFDATGIGLLRGTDFSGGDGGGQPAEVIVNEAMGKLLWPGRDPLGECVWFNKRSSQCYSVVGVVESASRDRVIESRRTPQYYLPLTNMPIGEDFAVGTVVVRTLPHEARVAALDLRMAIQEAFPEGIVTVTTMTEHLEREYRPWRLGGTLFSILGVIALVVAVTGFYSTMSYSVGQRAYEFGVRKALGAQMADIVGQVIAEGLRMALVGVVIGVVLALLSGRLISSLLYGVKPTDPPVLITVSGLILLVALLANIVPAWRASRVDPVRMLAAE